MNSNNTIRKEISTFLFPTTKEKFKSNQRAIPVIEVTVLVLEITIMVLAITILVLEIPNMVLEIPNMVSEITLLVLEVTIFTQVSEISQWQHVAKPPIIKS